MSTRQNNDVRTVPSCPLGGCKMISVLMGANERVLHEDPLKHCILNRIIFSKDQWNRLLLVSGERPSEVIVRQWYSDWFDRFYKLGKFEHTENPSWSAYRDAILRVQEYSKPGAMMAKGLFKLSIWEAAYNFLGPGSSTVRLVNGCRALGIKEIGDIPMYTREQFLRLRNIGRVTLHRLEQMMEHYGIEFAIIEHKQRGSA